VDGPCDHRQEFLNRGANLPSEYSEARNGSRISLVGSRREVDYDISNEDKFQKEKKKITFDQGSVVASLKISEKSEQDRGDLSTM
jgi:hypothetical protein